ncbi:diadenylate cyclase CdaA [Bacillus cereus]|uniref:DAC domain-containing protein n=1 Tax=Bacillus cereus TaxID=1396 RepID=A0A164QQY9_BACCE|nr:DNA integrity scanning protein DisA nucleotide-binding domain protein [Bacillus cereus]KZD72056.1 hypothetical protein B4088_0517 [Bacillus cereus]HDR8321565.1 DNA integrity scanning protein DisA nucleotide-binding domain protein [Bacillus cereus]HDR8333034.1 DNA integrity scanning protein DisA nucleotide-binding domain protein [Bacillus cereus]
MSYVDLIISITLWLVLILSLKHTKVWSIYVGLGFVYFIGQIVMSVGWVYSGQLIQGSVWVVGVGVIVLFQHELRVVLKKNGWIGVVRRETLSVNDGVVQAIFNMSKQKIGALIVLDNQKTIPFVSEDYVKVDAIVSASLIETIFYPETMLHDGAVIIQGKRLMYAGCKLPLSGKRRDGSERLGTRHMAAIENSEKYDVVILVVSEETGIVSIAKQGILTPISDEKELKKYISYKNNKNKM